MKVMDPFEIDNIYLFRPPHIISRITLQKGCFTVHPTDYLQKEYPWPVKMIRYNILAHSKPKILHALRAMGVNRSTIFGGLESIAMELRIDHKFCKQNCRYRGAL